MYLSIFKVIYLLILIALVYMLSMCIFNTLEEDRGTIIFSYSIIQTINMG